MQTLQYGARSTVYSVLENERLRAKIRIQVKPGGAVEVQTPIDTQASRVKAAVQKRARWIFANLDAALQTSAPVPAREYVGGETHFYLGRRYRLKVTLETKAPRQIVKLSGASLHVCVSDAQPSIVKLHVQHWYQLRAKRYFARRLHELASEIPWIAHTPALKIVPMQQQWGSCTPQGKVHLNPALIRAPRICIDYVLIHELCHLQEHNHSKAFYALLEKHCPHWRTIKRELDDLASCLLAE